MLGRDTFQDLEFFSKPITLKDNDLVILMSQGVFNALSWVKMEEVLNTTNSVQDLANNLINAVNNSPMVDKDNASVLICRRK